MAYPESWRLRDEWHPADFPGTWHKIRPDSIHKSLHILRQKVENHSEEDTKVLPETKCRNFCHKSIAHLLIHVLTHWKFPKPGKQNFKMNNFLFLQINLNLWNVCMDGIVSTISLLLGMTLWIFQIHIFAWNNKWLLFYTLLTHQTKYSKNGEKSLICQNMKQYSSRVCGIGISKSGRSADSSGRWRHYWSADDYPL